MGYKHVLLLRVQSEDHHNNLERFSKEVRRLMKKKGVKPSDLVNRGHFTRTTISRLCRNSNDKGGDYPLSLQDITNLKTALKLTSDEAFDLLFIAFPDVKFNITVIKENMDHMAANEYLYDNNSPLLCPNDEQF